MIKTKTVNRSTQCDVIGSRDVEQVIHFTWTKAVCFTLLVGKTWMIYGAAKVCRANIGMTPVRREASLSCRLPVQVVPQPLPSLPSLSPPPPPQMTALATATTVIFALVISCFGVLALVACIAMSLNAYMRFSLFRHSQQIQLRTPEVRETVTSGTPSLEGTHCQPERPVTWEVPVIWEVCVDEHPKPTSEWGDLMVCLHFVASSVPLSVLSRFTS